MTLEEASTREARPDLPTSSTSQPTDHLLEIGTGWGSLAVHAARDPRLPRDHDDDLARPARDRRAPRARGGARGPRDACCWRTTATSRGRYDKLVSVEMIEAVGWKDFGTFFARCSDLLEPDGAMLLQAITIDDRAYRIERASRCSSAR